MRDFLASSAPYLINRRASSLICIKLLIYFTGGDRSSAPSCSYFMEGEGMHVARSSRISVQVLEVADN